MMELSYDGSFIEPITLEKNVKYYSPVVEKGRFYPDFYSIIKIEGNEIPCILSHSKSDDDKRVIIDECKSFFGIEKLGIHRVYTNFTPTFKSDEKTSENTVLSCCKIKKLWYMYKCDWIRKDTIVFLPFVPFEDDDLNSERMYPLLQKIFLFRKLFRMRSPKKSIMIKHRALLPRIPISYDETHSNHVIEDGDVYKEGKISKTLEEELFPSMKSRRDTLDFMIGGLSTVNISRVRSEIEKVVIRINKDHISLVDSLFDDIYNLIDTS